MAFYLPQCGQIKRVVDIGIKKSVVLIMLVPYPGSAKRYASSPGFHYPHHQQVRVDELRLLAMQDSLQHLGILQPQ